MTEPANQIRPVPQALPATIEDLLAQRKGAINRTLNDYVDDIHTRLWSDEKYRRFIDAVYDEDAVEGDQRVDDYKAAELIRDFARETNVPMVGDKKLATIRHSLQVVLRRYGISRSERRNMLKGEIVPGGDDE